VKERAMARRFIKRFNSMTRFKVPVLQTLFIETFSNIFVHVSIFHMTDGAHKSTSKYFLHTEQTCTKTIIWNIGNAYQSKRLVKQKFDNYDTKAKPITIE
jgi:CRISPR/Cas system CMR-associated protein Cmr1 (group 7 of RAMP superfamily)